MWTSYLQTRDLGGCFETKILGSEMGEGATALPEPASQWDQMARGNLPMYCTLHVLTDDCENIVKLPLLEGPEGPCEFTSLIAPG